MLRKTYDWVMSLAALPQAPLALGVVAFCEGLFFPIPPDVLLMPVVLGNRSRALRYAALTIVCSIAGGSCGYAVGYFLQPVGEWILALTGGDFHAFQAWYAHWGALLIAVPIPYKITAIASGLAKLNFGLFIGVSVLVRGLRFSLEALLLKIYGEPIRAFVERRLALVASAAAVAIVALVMLLKFAH
ncbi:MAG TPA: DedA family protein [Phenylobacterium sp.]|jgi:membrane protein YqaA with SNARE-associated domain|uniref:YqaA family protein n=1 Tax=Phenylobacterium sp. TaxID=1871053 RepID=UPI002D5B8919|nr:DedA family protein [Phenylobacterium sp.]HZZ67924.1 DedA family protein [Phenylobacterium sp.]